MIKSLAMKQLPLVFALIAALVAAGCDSKGFSEKANESKGNVFRYPIVTNPTTLDPGKVQDGDTIDALQQIYEGLVLWGEDSKPAPNLAESWDVKDGGKTYVFHIKHGVKFHNGEPLTAENFKFAIERNCDPKFASETAEDYLGPVVGVLDKLHGKAKEVSGVKVVDDYTLQMTLDKPRPYFLGLLTYPVSFALPKSVGGKEIVDVSKMIGTGPFKAESFVPNQLLTLVKNADYHGGAPLVDKIERPVILEATTRLAKFKTGELDLVPLERQDLDALKSDTKYAPQLKYFDRPAIWYVGMNVKEYAPFANPKVRMAFMLAIDREKIVNEQLGGVNRVANGVLPPGVDGYREQGPAPKFDPAKAKQLLAEAGYPNGKGLAELTMNFREGRPDVKIVAESVASQLKQNLGVDVKLASEEWGHYLDVNNKKKHLFFHMRWEADYLDPQDFLSLLWSTTGSENKTYYSNPEIDKLCAQADVMLDEKARTPLYQKAEDLLMQDAGTIPIYFQRDAELISPRVTGLRESAFGHLPHTKVAIR